MRSEQTPTDLLGLDLLVRDKTRVLWHGAVLWVLDAVKCCTVFRVDSVGEADARVLWCSVVPGGAH